TRDRGAEQVVALVDGGSTQHRKDEVAGEFFAQIDDIKLTRAGLERLFFETVGLVALPDLCAVSNHLASEMILDPAQHHRRVESAGIGKHQLFYFLGCHDLSLHHSGNGDACKISGRISQTITAFCACSRFSAWSSTTERGPSSTSSVISSPRWAGRQCMTSAPFRACFISASLTRNPLKSRRRCTASFSRPIEVQVSV